jgi:hypothetical protein
MYKILKNGKIIASVIARMLSAADCEQLINAGYTISATFKRSGE